MNILYYKNLWVFPPPISSSSPGKEGQRSYDENYIYLHTKSQWKKIPISLYNQDSWDGFDINWENMDNYWQDV